MVDFIISIVTGLPARAETVASALSVHLRVRASPDA